MYMFGHCRAMRLGGSRRACECAERPREALALVERLVDPDHRVRFEVARLDQVAGVEGFEAEIGQQARDGRLCVGVI